MNYKCCFPEEWLGLEKEELQAASGLSGAVFCHKSGFLMTTETMEDAVAAAKISLTEFHEAPVLINFGGDEEAEALLRQLPGLSGAKILKMALPELPEMEMDEIFATVAMEKQDWKNQIKAQVKAILKEKPEAVYVEGDIFSTYPIVHALRKKHVPVLTTAFHEEKKILIRIPSGSCYCSQVCKSHCAKC